VPDSTDADVAELAERVRQYRRRRRWAILRKLLDRTTEIPPKPKL
jgi:hypothetical protein